MATPRVLSVNVGRAREVEWRGEMITTAIWKTPVTGRVALRGVNVAGDDQADRAVHGGPDKAVYAYARRHGLVGAGARPRARARQLWREPDGVGSGRHRRGGRRALGGRERRPRGRAAAHSVLEARRAHGG